MKTQFIKKIAERIQKVHMQKNITSPFLAILVCLITLTAIPLTALAENNNQFYFVGKSAPLGESSSTGKSANGIYLRWDVIEGKLPADIVKIQLKRNEETLLLLDVSVNALMTVNEIEKMFASPTEQQRLLKTIASLKKLSLANASLITPSLANIDLDFNASNFAKKMVDTIKEPNNSAWTYLASRQNFNIARARYRAYLDTEYSGTGEVTYTLTALNAAGTTFQLGRVSVTPGEKKQLLSVTNFKQIETKQCTASDKMKDHNTVVLNWASSGNITDKFATSLQLSGYQLYRTTENLSLTFTETDVVNRDLSAQAATLAHDQRGNMRFPPTNNNPYTLERVNEFLIMAESSEDEKGNVQPAYFETPRQLIAAGLKPGDKRLYYIVPIDFAGHMGEASATIVRVPDKIPPATPWNIRFRPRSGQVSIAAIEWDRDTVSNYASHFSNSRVICNTEEARITGKVDFADNLAACASPRHTRLGADKYLVYRFNSWKYAENFIDADGDGVSDADERGNGSSVGSECDPAITPTNKPNYLVSLPSNAYYTTTLPQTGRQIIGFNDSVLTQAENIGHIFWYRLATKLEDGRVSFLSAPVKAVFYDLVTPEKPQFTAYVEGNCCELQPVGKNGELGAWNFTDTIGKFDNISLGRSDGAIPTTSSVTIERFKGGICQQENSLISSYLSTGFNRVLYYPGITSGKNSNQPDPTYCRVSIPSTMNICTSGSWELVEKDCSKPLSAGAVVDSDATIVYEFFTSEADTCLIVMDTILGESSQVASSCNTDTPGTLRLLEKPGFCGYAIARDASGNTSARTQPPCSLLAAANKPKPPQITSMLLTGDNAAGYSADINWRLPLDPVAVTLVELSSDVTAGATELDDQLISVPNAGFEPAKQMAHTATIHALIGARDQWCVRLKAVSPRPAGSGQALSSDWSNKVCKIRRERLPVDTEYLPWPKVKNLTLRNNLSVSVAADYVDETLGNAYEKGPIVISIDNVFLAPYLLAADDNRDCSFREYPINFSSENPRSLLFARRIECYTYQSVSTINDHVYLPFIVYRQSKNKTETIGDWIQVSPLIDRIFWKVIDTKEILNDTERGKALLLDDPYIGFFRRAYDSTNWRLSFIDRYPYISGREYRYQMVIFDDKHAIKTVRQSEWVKTANIVNAGLATGVGVAP